MPHRPLLVVIAACLALAALVVAALRRRRSSTFATLLPAPPPPPPQLELEMATTLATSPPTSDFLPGAGTVPIAPPIWSGIASPIPSPTPSQTPTPLGEPPLDAVVGETLKDFTYGDSLVFPRGAAPEIRNITQTAPRTFRFELRHRGNPWAPNNPGGQRGAWYDGDRDLQWNEGRHKSFRGRGGGYKDKSRAEICCLKGYGTARGVKLGMGETWDIATTVRLDEDFVPSIGYCNIMQPVAHQSFLTLVGVTGNVVKAELRAFSRGMGSKQNLVRRFDIPRGEWVSIVVRVRFGKNGRYELSVNGDEFRGIDIDTTVGKQPFGPTWGLYMRATTSVLKKPMRDTIAHHRNVYIRRVDADGAGRGQPQLLPVIDSAAAAAGGRGIGGLRRRRGALAAAAARRALR